MSGCPELKCSSAGTTVASATVPTNDLSVIYLPWVPELGASTPGDPCNQETPLAATVLPVAEDASRFAPAEVVENRDDDIDDTERTCPACAERIKAAARVCRFCGRLLGRHRGPRHDAQHDCPPARP